MSFKTMGQMNKFLRRNFIIHIILNRLETNCSRCFSSFLISRDILYELQLYIGMMQRQLAVDEQQQQQQQEHELSMVAIAPNCLNWSMPSCLNEFTPLSLFIYNFFHLYECLMGSLNFNWKTFYLYRTPNADTKKEM